MYGAIIGDIVGSIYEYDEFNNSEGFLFNSLEEVEKNAELATIPSHNNEKSIRASKYRKNLLSY